MNDGPNRTSNQATNVAQLRAGIDAGQTADKIPYPDPAASPLGTDDEAGGAPMRPDAIAAAARRERVTAQGLPKQAPDKTGPWVWAIVLAVMLVIAAAAAVLYWPAV